VYLPGEKDPECPLIENRLQAVRPGLAERSIGMHETTDIAVTCDRFHPLRLSKFVTMTPPGPGSPFTCRWPLVARPRRIRCCLAEAGQPFGAAASAAPTAPRQGCTAKLVGGRQLFAFRPGSSRSAHRQAIFRGCMVGVALRQIGGGQPSALQLTSFLPHRIVVRLRRSSSRTVAKTLRASVSQPPAP
jgi:hypothetical protein